jgi:hypothetical protein
MKIRMERFERFERRVGPLEMLEIKPPPQIESGLMKKIVVATCARMGLSPEIPGMPTPEEEKP